MIETRKAFIISGSNLSVKNLEDIDINRKEGREYQSSNNIIMDIVQYLRSSIGGSWKDKEEICTLHTTKKNIIRIVNDCTCDYIFLFYTGHGINKEGQQVLEINTDIPGYYKEQKLILHFKEEIRLNEFKFSAKKILLVLNCCRRINGNVRIGDDDQTIFDTTLDLTIKIEILRKSFFLL
jgi:hypothetical protein